MAMPEPQVSAENKYLGHRMLFKLEHQRSRRGKDLITKITMKRISCLGEVGP